MRRKISILSIPVIAVLIGAIAIGSLAQKQPEGLSAEEAYAKLSENITILERGARTERSMERKIEILEEIDLMLSDFVKEYPDSPEAADAKFQLGLVNFTLQKSDRTIKYMTEFLWSAEDASRDKQAFAHYYLGESYKAAGDFEKAKREYDIVSSQYAGVHPQLDQMTRQNLDNLEFEKQLAVGKEPIPFAVTGINGEKISPADYKGKVLLLDFWATWCLPCKKEMPNVKRVYNKYKEKGFEIVGISLDKNRGALDDYIESNEITWPQFYDGKFWQNDVAMKYRVQSIPATYLIDKQGKIRYKSLRGKELELAVEKLLSE